jgi:hypothetical protein
MLALLLTLAIVGLGSFFLVIYFQFQRIENKIDNAVKDVEVFMLKQFGEVSPDSVGQNGEES